MSDYGAYFEKNIVKVDPHFRFRLISADPDDNKFVDCAIVGNAKFIVTEEPTLQALKTVDFPKVEVIGIDEFLPYCK